MHCPDEHQRQLARAPKLSTLLGLLFETYAPVLPGVRVVYDVEQEAQALRAVRHPDAERLAEMRRQGRFLAPAEI